MLQTSSNAFYNLETLFYHMKKSNLMGDLQIDLDNKKTKFLCLRKTSFANFFTRQGSSDPSKALDSLGKNDSWFWGRFWNSMNIERARANPNFEQLLRANHVLEAYQNKIWH